MRDPQGCQQAFWCYLQGHHHERADRQGHADRHSLRSDCRQCHRAKPGDLIVQQKAQDKFRKAFGFSRKDALEQGLVYNLVDGTAELGRPCPSWELSTTSWRSPAQVWRRFHCRKIVGRFVINGFYTCTREQFTKPGTAICYQQVEWNADQLKLEDFHGKGLGGTDPEGPLAPRLSLRRVQGLEGVGPRCRTQR